MSIKLLATSDLHLGRKSSGIPEDAEQSSAKYTWDCIIELSVNEKIDILVLAGDVVDQDNKYFEAIGQLQSGFERLKQSSINVVMVAGNHDHDVLTQIAGNEKYDHVHLLGAKGTWELKKFYKENDIIQIAGWSFPAQHVKEDPLFYFDTIDIDPNHPSIGVLHCDVYDQSSTYAPVNRDNLTNKNLNAWILGHIHKPDMLKKGNPCIIYPGSPHAFSAKEPGVHGTVLMEIDNTGDIKTKMIPLSPIRYESISADITNTKDEATLRDKITAAISDDTSKKTDKLENISFLVYDIHLKGYTSKIKELEKWALSATDYEEELRTGTKILVRKVETHAKPAVENIEELAKQPTPEGILAETILALQKGYNTPFLEELLKEWNYKLENINKAGVYQPLGADQKIHKKPGEAGMQYLLQECNRLLAELRMQQDINNIKV